MTLQEIAKHLKKLKSAAIFCHMRPDGDTLGAAMGGMDGITKEPDDTFEALIAVDSSDEFRLGALGDYFIRSKKPKFNIDHHISNSRFGDYCFVEERAATCEIMTELVAYFSVKLTPLGANYLLLGLSSDTGNFAHKNVTEKTFLAAAKLVSCGGDINLIQYNMFKKQSRARALLFGKTMSRIRYFEDNTIAFITVLRSDLQECGAGADVTEGFIDFPLSIDGVEVAVCLLETANERFKISLRSKGSADVNAVASVFGGGGHILASGCMLNGCLEEVIDKLRFTIKQHMVV